MFTKKTLPNGLRVLTVPMPAAQSVTVLVMVEAGSRYETKKINGLSHFLEHMIFKGTKNRSNSLAITSLVDGIGGSFNAFTTKEFTGFYIKAESRHLELLLDVLSDMLQNSLYDEKELDKERGVIIEEINMYEDQPQARVGELFEELLYSNSPLGFRIIGQKQNIKSLTRDDMTAYVNKMYHGNSMVVTVAGNVPCLEISTVLRHSGEAGRGRADSRISKMTDAYFGDIQTGSENIYQKVTEEQEKPASLVYHKKTDQAHLCLGVRAYDINHPDKYILDVLGTVLGGNMSSRLFMEVREKRGLAYYVHAESEEFLDCGFFCAQAGIRLEAADEAVKVILGEFSKFKETLISDEELQRAKDYATGKMALALEDSYRMASFFAGQELLQKKIETPTQILGRIRAVTKEDIQRVAKDIFVDHNLNFSIVGPFTDQEKFEKLLEL